MAQTPARIGFFGPFGTFTEQALLTQPDLAVGELIPFRSVPDVLNAVARGDVDAGFVPIENSIEGTVNFTQDALIFDYELLIQREVVLDIEHCLLAAPGTKLSDVSLVLSIPVATAQCSAWLRENLSKADVHAANSTADAARLVGERSSAGERESQHLHRRMLLRYTDLKLSRRTLQIMQVTKHVSFLLRVKAFQQQLVMTKLVSLFSNAPTNRAVSSRSCKSSRHVVSTCRCCHRDQRKPAVLATTASLFMPMAMWPTN